MFLKWKEHVNLEEPPQCWANILKYSISMKQSIPEPEALNPDEELSANFTRKFQSIQMYIE